MAMVFISYRRGQTAGEARALCNELVAILGRDSVFMDVDAIALGRDFRTAIRDRLESCDQILVVVGRDWADARNASGRRALDDPDDFVRLEVHAALKRSIPVTPVLVQGAAMPGAGALPAEIKDFAYRHAFELRHDRWESDVAEMIQRLGLGPPRGARRGGALALRRMALRQATAWAAAVGAILAAGLLVLWLTRDSTNQSVEHPPAGVSAKGPPPPPTPGVRDIDTRAAVPNTTDLQSATKRLESGNPADHRPAIETLARVSQESARAGADVLQALASYVKRAAAIHPPLSLEEVAEESVCRAPLEWPAGRSRPARHGIDEALQAGLELMVSIQRSRPDVLTPLDWNNVDLSRMNLEGMNLERARLWGAVLRNSRLAYASLTQADLRRADLSEATLHDARLEGAMLSRANLRKADLTRARLDQADLRKVELSGATLVNARMGKAIAWGSNLRDAVLLGAELNGADLGGADLARASLENANLEGALLWFSTPCIPTRPANLTDARLGGARLKGAHLEAAILTDARDLTEQQLREAITNVETVRPRSMRSR
jgi:uncharacterized protein YjbI with pentapeptide repeats